MSSVQQIGQAIHVKDSNIERQPSADARRPRISDSDVIIQVGFFFFILISVAFLLEIFNHCFFCS